MGQRTTLDTHGVRPDITPSFGGRDTLEQDLVIGSESRDDRAGSAPRGPADPRRWGATPANVLVFLDSAMGLRRELQRKAELHEKLLERGHRPRKRDFVPSIEGS